MEDGKIDYIQIVTHATVNKNPKAAVRDAVITAMQCVPGCELTALDGAPAKTIRNPGGVPSKWQGGMEYFVGLKTGLEAMRPVKGGRDKSRPITCTIRIQVKMMVDVDATLDSASINLQDERLELSVKKNKGVARRTISSCPWYT